MEHLQQLQTEFYFYYMKTKLYSACRFFNSIFLGKNSIIFKFIKSLLQLVSDLIDFKGCLLFLLYYHVRNIVLDTSMRMIIFYFFYYISLLSLQIRKYRLASEIIKHLYSIDY